STSPITNTITNATATATMNSPGCISQASSSSKCSGFNLTSGTPYAITSATLPGAGSGFAGSVTFGNGNKVSGISISNVGSGYTSGTGSVQIKDNSGNTCSVASVTFTTGSQVSSIAVAAGSGGAYMSQPSANLGGTAPSAPASPVLPAL